VAPTGAERERSRQVDREGPVGELSTDPAGDPGVEQEAPDGGDAADQSDAHDDDDAHPLSRARLTRFVATATAANPLMMLTNA
jgi:hypothetical protein